MPLYSIYIAIRIKHSQATHRVRVRVRVHALRAVSSQPESISNTTTTIFLTLLHECERKKHVETNNSHTN